ncbi:unnamed protein product, partial [Nesidiocoris tenuis]
MIKFVLARFTHLQSQWKYCNRPKLKIGLVVVDLIFLGTCRFSAFRGRFYSRECERDRDRADLSRDRDRDRDGGGGGRQPDREAAGVVGGGGGGGGERAPSLKLPNGRLSAQSVDEIRSGRLTRDEIKISLENTNTCTDSLVTALDDETLLLQDLFPSDMNYVSGGKARSSGPFTSFVDFHNHYFIIFLMVKKREKSLVVVHRMNIAGIGKVSQGDIRNDPVSRELPVFHWSLGMKEVNIHRRNVALQDEATVTFFPITDSSIEKEIIRV